MELMNASPSIFWRDRVSIFIDDLDSRLGALAYHRKRRFADPLRSSSCKKPRLHPSPPPSSAVSFDPLLSTPPSRFRPLIFSNFRAIQSPKRIRRLFGFGSKLYWKLKHLNFSKMGSCFSLSRQGVSFNEHTDLGCNCPADTGNRDESEMIYKPYPKKNSGLAVLIPKEDKEHSSPFLNQKPANGGVIVFETTPVRYAVVARKKQTYIWQELYENFKKYVAWLNDLDICVKLAQVNISGLRTEAESIRTRKDELKDDHDEFEEDEEICNVLYGHNSHEIVVKHKASSIEISGMDLQCLEPGNWLNDEVINLYLELLKERENRNHKNFLKCHFFNTFFYQKLACGKNGFDFKAVSRWTTKSKLGYTLIECDKVFVPIHKGAHWSLAIINIKDKTLQYLDSLGGMDTHLLNVLARYITQELRDKSDTEIDLSSWKKVSVYGIPQQRNGSDCGMFMIKYIDFYCRGLKPSFDQKDMKKFRRKTMKEILRLRVE